MDKPSPALCAARLAEQRHTRDPFALAAHEGIEVCRYDLGSLGGFYAVVNQTPFIALSADADGAEARLLCAHELGHHFLHRAIAETKPLLDNGLFSGGGRLENEANLFAAELLIADRDFLSAAKTAPTLDTLAAELGERWELVALKSEILRAAGGHFRPFEISADFLRKNISKNS